MKTKRELVSRGFTKRMSLEERALALKEGREQRLRELQEADIPYTPKPRRRRIAPSTMVKVTLFATSSRPLVVVMPLEEATQHGYYSYEVLYC